jgi:hypothetical protein
MLTPKYSFKISNYAAPLALFSWYNNFMSEVKTKVNDADVNEFINSVADEKKRRDGLTLLEMFKRITGEQPKMWGSSIIGFGQYHYKSEKSRQEGDWLLTGFSPRKQALTLYIMHGLEDQAVLLEKLGKHKTGMGCMYINKLGDVNLDILEDLIKKSYSFMKEKHN